MGVEPIILAVGLYKMLGWEGGRQAGRSLDGQVHCVPSVMGATFALFFCGILAHSLQKAEPTDWQGRGAPLLPVSLKRQRS